MGHFTLWISLSLRLKTETKRLNFCLSPELRSTNRRSASSLTSSATHRWFRCIYLFLNLRKNEVIFASVLQSVSSDGWSAVTAGVARLGNGQQGVSGNLWRAFLKESVDCLALVEAGRAFQSVRLLLSLEEMKTCRHQCGSRFHRIGCIL